MSVATELATRTAYMEISCDLLYRRYGRAPLRRLEKTEQGEIYRRAERDLVEYERLTRRPARRRRP